jgi:hypothetical protein
MSEGGLEGTQGRLQGNAEVRTSATTAPGALDLASSEEIFMFSGSCSEFKLRLSAQHWLAAQVGSVTLSLLGFLCSLYLNPGAGWYDWSGMRFQMFQH